MNLELHVDSYIYIIDIIQCMYIHIGIHMEALDSLFYIANETKIYV